MQNCSELRRGKRQYLVRGHMYDIQIDGWKDLCCLFRRPMDRDGDVQAANQARVRSARAEGATAQRQRASPLALIYSSTLQDRSTGKSTKPCDLCFGGADRL
jgi:hypothetical protein